MNKKTTWIAATALLVAAGAFAGAVTSQFEIQAGGTSGIGTLNKVPFKWKTSAAAEKTLDTQLRVNNFSGNQVEFLFETSPVLIESLTLVSVNPASQYAIEFYDTTGTLIPPGNVTVSSPDGVTGFPVSQTGNILSVSGSEEGSGAKNCRMDITLTPALQNVSRIVVHVQKENGLLDLRFKGNPGR